MNTKPHPTDAMEMPPKIEAALAKLSWASHVFLLIEPRNSFERVSYGNALHDLQSAIHTLDNLTDQLRAARIKAYDLGRKEALEDVEKKCGDIGPEAYKVFQAIRSMKHEQQ